MAIRHWQHTLQWLRHRFGQRWLLLSVGILSLITVLGLPLLRPEAPPPQSSSYARSQLADFNRPDHYPLAVPPAQALADGWYRPVADWVGRLILPPVAAYAQAPGDWVWFEVQAAPQPELIGQVVKLTWQETPEIQRYLDAVTVDVQFGEAAARAQRQGDVVPTRLNGRQQVGPLQSLAGARPVDDVLVRLTRVTIQRTGKQPEIAIQTSPVQIGGRLVALVALLETVPRSPLPADCPGGRPCPSEYFRVRHYNPSTQRFDGPEAVVRIPQQPRDRNGRFLSTPRDLVSSPAGAAGWYLYGAFDQSGVFTAQALQPRSLMQLQPDQVILGTTPTLNFITWQNWRNLSSQKGTLQRILLSATAADEAAARKPWQVGDRGLVMHLFGGIGGKRAEGGTPGTVTGHFAYGVAEVVRDRFTQEPRFDITYHQIYAHNPNAIISGTLDWSAYTGHLERGWLGSRPIADIIVKLDTLTQPLDLGSQSLSLFETLLAETQMIAARYRTGDGTGVATVTPATSCVQDSSQALYLAIEAVKRRALSTPDISDWLATNPSDQGATQFWAFVNLGKDLANRLAPYGVVRPDWQHNAAALAGVNARNGFVSSRSLVNTLLSWRSMMPRRAHDELSLTFLTHGAQLWVLRTHQVGGWNPEMTPLAPTLLFGQWPIIGTLTKRLGDAVSAPMPPQTWGMVLGALLVYGAIALPFGFRSGFLEVAKIQAPRLRRPLGLLKLLVMPAMVEEALFRVLLLPHPIEGVAGDRWVLWALVSLATYVLYHPLNARWFYPPGRGVFSDRRFLLLTTLLGLTGTGVYRLTGSFWAIVLIHWIVVVFWLLLLGGNQRLATQPQA